MQEFRQWRRIASVAIAFLVLAAVFAITLKPRAFLFGRFPGGTDGLWRINSDYALSAARNWFTWGPWNLGFQIFLGGWAGARPTIQAPYFSYPPFFVAVPWMISQFTGKLPSMELLCSLSLAAQFLLGLGLSLFLFFVEGGYLLAVLAGAVCMASPGMVYFFQNVWWPDLIALPFYVWILAMEAAPETVKQRRWFPGVFATLLTLGLFADWLILMLAGFIFFKRIREKKRTGDLVGPICILLLYEILFLLYSRGFDQIKNKILERTGLDGSQPIILDWNSIIFPFGLLGKVCFAACAALSVALAILLFLRMRMAISKESLRKLELVFLLNAPIFLHFVVLRQHYMDHDYAWLKFGIPMFSVALCHIPALVLPSARRKSLHYGIIGCVFVVTALYVSSFPKVTVARLSQSDFLPPEVEKNCATIASQKLGGMVLVSPHLATDPPPFQGVLLNEPALLPPPANFACYFPIQLMKAPNWVLESMRTRKLPVEYDPLLEGHSKMVAIFLHEVPSEWLPYLEQEIAPAAGDFRFFALDLQKILTSIPKTR